MILSRTESVLGPIPIQVTEPGAISVLPASSSYVYNADYDAGQVVWQSAEAGTRVEAGTKVYLQISKGPRVQFIEGEVIGDGAVSDEGGVW